MRIIRWLYLALLIGAGLFVILYVDSLPILLLAILILVPIVLFILLLLARLCTSVDAEISKSIATVGETVTLSLNIRNRSFVPLTSVRVPVVYRNKFLEEERTALSFPLYPLSKKKLQCEITSPHAGVVRVELSAMVLQDYFRMFSFKIPLKREFEVSFLPEIQPAEIDLRPNVFLSDSSEEFSKTKKGDDPSEVFDIRDYVGGDKLNRIHWKLSSKMDTIMVKDYSLPINHNILILAELALPDGNASALELMDGVIQTVACLSQALCDHSLRHSIGWYDPGQQRFYTETIKEESDLYTALGLMLTSALSGEPDSFTNFSDNQNNYSHIAYVTALPTEMQVQALQECAYRTFCSVFEVKYPDTEAYGSSGDGVAVYALPCHSIADSLSGIVL